MRQAYEDRSATSAKGRAATEKARFQYTWQNSAERMVERMARFDGYKPMPVSQALCRLLHMREMASRLI